MSGGIEPFNAGGNDNDAGEGSIVGGAFDVGID